MKTMALNFAKTWDDAHELVPGIYKPFGLSWLLEVKQHLPEPGCQREPTAAQRLLLTT